jgi:hypothetical protein
MELKERFRIHRLAIPLKTLVQGHEKEIGEAIAWGFVNLKHIYLLAGDGSEDARWTLDRNYEAKIQRWHSGLWAKIHPKRPTLPTIEFEIIPGHVAHYYNIDNFVY